MKTKLIVIAGPTAVGKTALGIALAKDYNGEIISGDSQQVYRSLDIGTAKASREEQEAVHHHLIDVRDPDENYSVYDFVTEARKAIAAIQNKGKLPILVGGTGLYLQSLLEGYHLGGEVDQAAVLAYRQELENLTDHDLFERLETNQIQLVQKNRRRAIRALELATFAENATNQRPAYEPFLICLTDDRQVLYERINQRVDTMLDQGLLDEARWLYETYPHAQATRGIGYKEFFPYFSGEASLDEAVAQVKQNTRRFAKRQLTWFKNRMEMTFYQVSDPELHSKLKQELADFLET